MSSANTNDENGEEPSGANGRSISKRDDRALAGEPMSHNADAVSRSGRLDKDEKTKPGPFWRSAHGLSAMNIDESSFVINGDITREKTQGGSRIHVAHSGSVTNQSFLCNGDMDRESFLRLMGSK